MANSLILLIPTLTRREKVEVEQKARLSPEGEKTRKIKRQGMANSLIFLAPTPTSFLPPAAQRAVASGQVLVISSRI